MGVGFILLGLFLWFALAFNGGIGSSFYNFSLFTSALFMIITGSLAVFSINNNGSRRTCLVALVCYLPVVWKRIDCLNDPDAAGLLFDVIFIALMFFLYRKNLTNRLRKGRRKAAPLSSYVMCKREIS